MSETAPEAPVEELEAPKETDWKAEARKWQARAKENKTAADRLSEIEEKSKTDLERAVDAARRETEEKVTASVLADRVLDRVEVLAAKDFADPEDARLHLGGRAGDFVKDGKPDAKAISAALEELLKNRPHLAARPTGRPSGDVGQGPRTTSGPPSMNDLIRGNR